MNYFAHGLHFVDEPYVLAGTAVPDWLNVVNRRAKARSSLAQPFVDDADECVANIARGILRHHSDDRWFHQTRAFAELSLQFTVAIRDRLSTDTGFRPSFVGHILVELLLDAELIEQSPERLARYYSALDSLDPKRVAQIVNRMCTRTVDSLAVLIPRFSSARFLYDYTDDEKLLARVNNVMDRIRLPLLPAELAEYFPAARHAVRFRVQELLNEYGK